MRCAVSEAKGWGVPNTKSKVHKANLVGEAPINCNVF